MCFKSVEYEVFVRSEYNYVRYHLPISTAIYEQVFNSQLASYIDFMILSNGFM